MVDEIKSLYKTRNEERGMVEVMANIMKNMDGDEKGSLKIKEDFLKNNFDFAYFNELKSHYKKNNEKEKYLKLINSYDRIMPFNPSFKSDLISYYFNKKEFDKSKEVIDELLTYRPNVSSLYREIGDLYFNTEEKNKAISYYEKASNLQPSSYYLKNKIYNLKYKKDLVNEISMIDPDQAIQEFKKKSIKEEGHDYVIILNENVHIRPGGGGVMNLVQYMIVLKNQKALDDWQRIDFSGGGTTNIEKAQVIKKNGTKIEGERHGDEVVFTNMEIGDYLYVKYNEEITSSGKISKFWDEQYNFNGSRPALWSKYQILIDKNEPYQIKLINNNIPQIKTTINNFEKLVYEAKDLPIIKDEAYSNGYDSISQLIVLSSKSNWDDVVKWYEDISDEQSNAEFDSDLLIKEIFERDLTTYTEKEKAEKIYNYIVKNVQYSSISFRQSGIIPQRASDVYHTKIGDCKDMSNLYKAIARTVGLKSNLVLISTSDNGKNSVVNPSLNFNHCIVKVNVDNKPFYVELTDPSLNFGTLDYYHQNANILEIDSKVKGGLTLLKSNTQNESKILKQSKVEIKEGNRIVVSSKFTGYGKRASLFRSSFKDSQDDAKKETIISMISSSYENSINLKDYKLYNIDTTLNDAGIETNYEVDKAISKIGSFFSFKLPFSDLIFDPNTFAEDSRKYGFDFNQYENTNTYEESFNINLKNNLIFESTPENVKLQYGEMDYILSFQKVNEKEMNVKRTFKSTRQIIGPEKFVELKEFVNNILEAENTNLALKILK